MSNRIFYAAGPGDVIQAHKYWMAGEPDPTQVSITFSSQFEDFCRDTGAKAYIVSYNDKRQILRDGPFTLEHRPKPMPGAIGIRYHASEVLYAFSLLATALRFGANWAVLESGSTHFFAMSLFRLAGMRVVPILHNSLWPSGFPPRSLVRRVIAQLDSWFFRFAATATIGVSPECIRQVDQLTNGRHNPMYQIRAQYRPEVFATVPPPPPLDRGPFRILFLGRIDYSKGAFDVLEMARKIEDCAPKRVHWDLCGGGKDFEKLRKRTREMRLESIISLHGWTAPKAQVDLRARSHAVIVPTRSSFPEGMAMTAIEGILSGRPVITSRVTPALEVLRPACVEARPDAVDSYVESILRLIDNPNWYIILCRACTHLQGPFYDREQGQTAVLKRVFSQNS